MADMKLVAFNPSVGSEAAAIWLWKRCPSSMRQEVFRFIRKIGSSILSKEGGVMARLVFEFGHAWNQAFNDDEAFGPLAPATERMMLLKHSGTTQSIRDDLSCGIAWIYHCDYQAFARNIEEGITSDLRLPSLVWGVFDVMRQEIHDRSSKKTQPQRASSPPLALNGATPIYEPSKGAAKRAAAKPRSQRAVEQKNEQPSPPPPPALSKKPSAPVEARPEPVSQPAPAPIPQAASANSAAVEEEYENDSVNAPDDWGDLASMGYSSGSSRKTK